MTETAPTAKVCTSTASRVEVGGVKIRVRVVGRPGAPAVLLLHGIGRSLEDWSAAQDLLALDHHVVAMDHPGFGLTAALPGRPSLQSLARAATCVLDELGLGAQERPVTVMGNSLGGAVAMTLASASPDRVSALVLVNSAGFGRKQNVDITPMLLLAFSRVPVFGGWFRHRIRPAMVAANRRIFADASIITQEVEAHDRLVASQPGYRSTFVRLGLSIGAPIIGVHSRWRRRLIQGVNSTDIPVLVVWGQRDGILPVSHFSAALAALPQARGHLFTDAAHMPQRELPSQFVEVVTGFLDEASAAMRPR